MCVATIRVRTTCTQTAWHGGCEQFTATCSQTQVNQIAAALCAIIRKVDGCTLSALQGLKSSLRRASQDVVWKCGTLGPGVLAQTDSIGGSEITLAPSAFGSTSARFEAIVFHELVHHAGGTELDAEAFENHCYAGAGATGPTDPGDFDSFRADGGNFVSWNQSSGALATTAGDALSPNFIDPTPPAGGGGGWI